MKSRPITTFQNFLVVAFFIAGFLGAAPLVACVGFNVPFLLASFVVACITFVGFYRARLSPFFYRLPLAFITCLSSFTVLFMLYTLVPK